MLNILNNVDEFEFVALLEGYFRDYLNGGDNRVRIGARPTRVLGAGTLHWKYYSRTEGLFSKWLSTNGILRLCTRL
jgi:hypothetical protein